MKNIITKPHALILMLALSAVAAVAAAPRTAAEALEMQKRAYDSADAVAQQEAEDEYADEAAAEQRAQEMTPAVDNSKNPLSVYSDGSRCASCDSIVVRKVGGLPTEYPYQHGKANGMVKQWGRPGNGMAYVEFPMVDGKREGTMRYVTSGGYEVKVDYQEDTCLGGFIQYDPRGRKMATGAWFKSRPYTPPGDSIAVVYATVMELYPETGNLLSMAMRDMEWPYLLDGMSTWYSDDGRVLGKAKFSHGKLVGKKVCTDGRSGGADLDCL